MTSEEIDEARKRLGLRLRTFRKAAGYTQLELAKQLGYSRARIAGAENGESCAALFWQCCDNLLNADGALIAGYEEIETLRQKRAKEAAEAERRKRIVAADAAQEASRQGAAEKLHGFKARSHKFITAYVGHDIADQLANRERAKPTGGLWLDSQSARVAHSSGICTLHIWPFGVAIFHLVEEITMPNIASLALWRIRSYAENLAWASHRLGATLGKHITASYVLGAYWVTEPQWPDQHLDNALRIMCTPRILLQREPSNADQEQAQAEEAERRIFAAGHDGSGLTSFGLSGVSIGYASWSGVVYHPISPVQSLTEDDLVSCELASQAIWTYCDHINSQVESGHDPVVPDSHGWKFLRGTRSRLLNPRPQETGQHRAMRDAIVATSGLIGHLDHAISALRETMNQ
ncbi:hypothetical protein Acsp04_58760 [Actinomadura sp. NBRC 104425]|uniref:helix-turn-helix domain-containing protein n=1 Tax=Actinomadura sp. NBRC 104425 TaxID=3032204 RepID=UPI0024A1925D|nr:helix-turn-helix domain-containing protein [Actinomadura sp. NBRC 104425]GLZ15641.1 hypothetical protein Acsp04_58760 [Actinomadura sp. NBRC 104425]